MRPITLATAALAALVAVTAQAHGPTRRKITESIEVNAPADKVWAIAGDWKDASWLQNVIKTEPQGDDPAKSKRVLTLKSGNPMLQAGGKYKPEDRLFMFYIEKVDVKDLPANDFSGTITVESAGDAKAKVEWRAAFYRGYMNNDPPPELNDEASEKAVRAWVRASLENLRARAEKGS
jgi:hypothetical protein